MYIWKVIEDQKIDEELRSVIVYKNTKKNRIRSKNYISEEGLRREKRLNLLLFIIVMDKIKKIKKNLRKSMWDTERRN